MGAFDAQNDPICDDEDQSVPLSILENSMARITLISPESANAEVNHEKTLRGKPATLRRRWRTVRRCSEFSRLLCDRGTLPGSQALN
jgi:hypothetical protein